MFTPICLTTPYNAEGDSLQLTEAEAKLLLFFTGREYHDKTMLIHLYSVAGHFRSLIKEKIDEAIPEPPREWYQYINDYGRTIMPEASKLPRKAFKSQPLSRT